MVRDYPLETELFYRCPQRDARFQALLEVLRHFEGERVLILCHYRFEAETMKEGLAKRFGARRVQPFGNQKRVEPLPTYTVMNLQADEWETARPKASIIVYYSSNWS